MVSLIMVSRSRSPTVTSIGPTSVYFFPSKPQINARASKRKSKKVSVFLLIEAGGSDSFATGFASWRPRPKVGLTFQSAIEWDAIDSETLSDV
jgi:hypothetical protein